MMLMTGRCTLFKANTFFTCDASSFDLSSSSSNSKFTSRFNANANAIGKFHFSRKRNPKTTLIQVLGFEIPNQMGKKNLICAMSEVSIDTANAYDSLDSSKRKNPRGLKEDIYGSKSDSPVLHAEDIKLEIMKCYALVEKMGKGVVYLGSSRTPKDHPFFNDAAEMSREVSSLLGSTTWSGIGAGIMDAVTLGAFNARNPVAGFKIRMEAMGHSSYVHPYLPPESYTVCNWISARKAGLVHAGRRKRKEDRTAFVAFPGGIGTLDEMFDVLTLIQLNKFDPSLPVPCLIMNYDGFYDGLLEYLDDLRSMGALAEGELQKLCSVFSTNYDALEYLADYYDIKNEQRHYRTRLDPAQL